jgi:adenylate kinase family enzyme
MLSHPSLIVVSGPPGTGKTTLAHEIATVVGCPAICRDEIKEGMAHATPEFDRIALNVLVDRGGH